MAKIWFVKEDTFPMRGHKQADRSVAWCVERLGLAPKQRAPSAGVIGGADLSGAGCSRVVVSIGREDDEPAAANWLRGFYLLTIDPDEARRALGLALASDPA
ncbi:MAG TPA: hypothetical protein VKH64_11325 [Candidatus Binatia bacterium]|nr:hypothetical protein [Candidatus Binatia bacterium]